MPKKKASADNTKAIEVKLSEEEAAKEKAKKPIKRSKKKNAQLVDEAQKHSNLPVIKEEELSSEFMNVEPTKKNKKKKAPKVDRRKLSHDSIVGDKSAAYVEVIGKRGHQRKFIRYNTNIKTGLSSDVVDHRIGQGLTNSKPTGSTKTIPAIIFGNLITFFNIVTIAIAIWILVTAGVQGLKQCFFVVIVAINTVISTVQEIRSKLIIDKLSIVSAPTATILRDGDIYDIPVNDIVLDDIVCLSSGKQICADSILVDGEIEVNESLLTGESDSIHKKVGDVLYSGSFVVSGNGKARVDRVGKDNYIEKLSGQAKKYRKPKSDLMKTLKMIIRVAAIVIIPLGTGVFFRQWQSLNLTGMSYFEAMKTADGISVVETTAGAVIGMIPSGLFLCTSIALAVGVIRLAKNKTLVQELYCIEMLARVDVLCLDKTGTITDGSMSVKNVIEYKNDTGLRVANIISAMQNALEGNNVTSKALDEYFGRGKRMKHKSLIPFSSARKFSAVEFDKAGTFILGAPEYVLPNDYNLVSTNVSKAASEGYRVLLLAHSKGQIVNGAVEGERNPIALILIEDTIRPDAIETIEYFKSSGVEVKVISGDNPVTVSRISQRAGIENADKYISLEGLTDKEVIRSAAKYTVFGRVSPNQKKLLVLTLKELGKTVAMTGDGVNDILALREADCSIALASGSEAARNVSHLVLLDSNFGSMPKVVAEGRRVINNVQKVAALFLTKTIFSFLLALYCTITKGSVYPIKPVQLFLIETFVIGVPSFVLALEGNNNKVEGKFITNVFKNALPGAIVITITTILIFILSGVLGLNKAYDPATFESLRLGANYETISIIVINATFTSFVVLFKTCKPFNTLRRIMFALMALIAVVVILAVPGFLLIVQILPGNISYIQAGWPHISIAGFLLAICLAQASYPLIKIVENIRPWTKNAINYLLNLVNKIH